MRYILSKYKIRLKFIKIINLTEQGYLLLSFNILRPINLMAKKSMVEREKKRINLNIKYRTKRENLLQQYQKTDGFKSKLEIHSKIQKLPRNSAKNRIRNRCWKTGRSRGYYRDFGISRHVLREMAHSCLLPGVTKSSW